jgi:hypothetical protein
MFYGHRPHHTYARDRDQKTSIAYNDLTYKKTKDEYDLEDSFQAVTGQFLIKRRLKERI